ncbi:MAG: recombinase family protein [Acutalibacteraceae bacterium]
MGWIKKNIELQPFMEILFDSDEKPIDENGNIPIDIAYRRVSTDKQAEEGFGLEVQKEDIVNYCKRNNIQYCILLTDDGYTGTTLDRPGIQYFISMVQHYNAGFTKIKVNKLIVAKLDRLARTLNVNLQFIQDYILSAREAKSSLVNTNEEAIHFISVAEPFCRVDPDNPTSTLMFNLFATLAEFDRGQIVTKLKRGRNKRIEGGKWHGGGNVPYGYRYDKKSGTLIVVPEEKEKVQEIFRLYVEEKMPPQKIADRLGFKSDKIITQILKRRSLLGYVSVDGKEYKGLHEPLISESLFDAAQEEMKLRSVVRGNPHYLLTGLIYCGECGAKMRYQKWNKAGECKIVCYSQQPSKKNLVKDINCQNDKYWQSEIEDAVIGYLLSCNYFGNEKNVKSKFQINVTKNIRKNIKEEKQGLKRLYNLYAKNIAENKKNDDVLLNTIDETKARIENYQTALHEEEEKELYSKKVMQVKDKLRSLAGSWDYMSQQERQTVCRELIEKVVIHKGGTVDVHLRLEKYLFTSSQK